MSIVADGGGIKIQNRMANILDPDEPSHLVLHCLQGITKTRLFKYIDNFTTKKGKFSDKKF